MMKLFFRSSFWALGTKIHIEIVFESKRQVEKARKDIKEAKKVFLVKQKVFCRFNPASELSKLNKNVGVWRKASPDLMYLARRVLFYNRESGGLYDPRVIDALENIGYKSDKLAAVKSVPKFGRFRRLSTDLKIRGNKIFFGRRMDFSGIAKGYIIDQAAACLRRRGWENFFINVNGDAYAAGFDKKGEKWKLPIEGARNKNAVAYFSNQGIATSGVIKRQWKYRGKNVHHLINPKNPEKFSFELRSVLVLHRKTEWADGRAKVLVLMGLKKGLRHAKRKKLKAFFIDKQREVIPAFNVRVYNPVIQFTRLKTK